MRNVSDELCTENQNTNFMFSNFSPKIVLFLDNVEKYPTARQAIDVITIRHMRFVRWITKARVTHSEYVTHITFPLLRR
jgi:hypothetical protein